MTISEAFDRGFYAWRIPQPHTELMESEQTFHIHCFYKTLKLEFEGGFSKSVSCGISVRGIEGSKRKYVAICPDGSFLERFKNCVMCFDMLDDENVFEALDRFEKNAVFFSDNLVPMV